MNTLRLGDKNGDVKVLQKYLCLPQDGQFGQKTEAAVKSFQKIRGLIPDGIVGNKTWLKIIEEDLKNDRITDADMIKIAIRYNIELAVIKAIKEVESGNKGIINGIPVMLFEGHVFWQQLQKRGISPYNHLAGNENILYRSWTKKYYTGSNIGEYNRLKKAMKINEEAAYASASYGMFQIMGYNYNICNYGSAKDFFYSMSQNEDNQLYSFVDYIEHYNIIPYMRCKNWKKIAYLYNGPEYSKNQYDIKLQRTYNKYK